nr:BTB/POZ domain-containing protein At2g04740 [Ipomoea batatas]
MLLECGAICSKHTFDRDRCHYAALNLKDASPMLMATRLNKTPMLLTPWFQGFDPTKVCSVRSSRPPNSLPEKWLQPPATTAAVLCFHASRLCGLSDLISEGRIRRPIRFDLALDHLDLIFSTVFSRFSSIVFALSWHFGSVFLQLIA